MSLKGIEENHCLNRNATYLEFKNNKFNHNVNGFLKDLQTMTAKKKNERKFVPLDIMI